MWRPLSIVLQVRPADCAWVWSPLAIRRDEADNRNEVKSDECTDWKAVNDALGKRLGVLVRHPDTFASNLLIPRHFTNRLHDLRTDADVVRFAREVGIAPGVVVGRLHNDEIWGWNRGNHLRQKIDFKDLWTG